MSGSAGERAARTVLVTGASSGIGAAIAKAFAANGDRVAIGARRLDRLSAVSSEITSAGGEVFAHELDVTSAASIEAFLSATREALGPIEVAINNAGISLPNWVRAYDPADFERELATNLLGPMMISRGVLDEMCEREAGDVVFIGSENAHHPRPQQAGYSASKAGLENFCRTLALELEGTGVRVTHIRLGPTQSEFGLDWSKGRIESVVKSWVPYGFTRFMDMLSGDDVAQAILHAVAAPRMATWANIELQPTAPRASKQREG